MSTAVGSVVGGRFRVEALLGQGGMGYVVAATHLELGHRVALKFMRLDMATSAPLVERFLREARSVVKLRTEHVCRVLDVARSDDGAPYIVMEMLDGVDLSRVVAQKPLAMTIAVEYVLQACVALAEAHATGLVHRDLKPANLFVTRRGDGGALVKVLDFGIAKAMSDDASLTRTSMTMGSPGYMSPEQIQSARDVDARTDIWALGVTLYQLLSARIPFPAASVTEIALRIAAEPPVPIDVDPRLAAIIYRCLEKAPDRRYQDVVALAADLAPFGGPAGVRIASEVAVSAGRALPGQVSAPRALPVATQASAIGVAPTVGATQVTSAGATTSQEAPRRSRGPIIAVVALAAIGTAIAIVVLASGAKAPPAARDAAPVAFATPEATRPLDAGPPSDAAAVVDAMELVDVAAVVDAMELVDAGELVDAAAAAIDAGRATRPRIPASAAAAMAGAMAQMRPACLQMTKSANVDMMPPLQLAICWCALGDAAHAKALYAKLAPQNQRTIRDVCEQNGVTL